MGKLATTGRLVTRDNEEQKVSVWLLGRSDASSGRALLAVSIRGFAVRDGIATVTGSTPIDRNDSAGAVPTRFEHGPRRRWERRRETTVAGIRLDRSRDSPDKRESLPLVETAASDEEGVVRRDASSSIVLPLDRPRGRPWSWWYDDIVENGGDPEYRSRISDERRGSSRCEESVERRTYVEARESERRRRRWYPRRWLAGSNELSLLFGIVTIVAVAAALCVPAASAVPTLSRETPLSRTGPRHDLDRSTGLEDVYEDAFEDVFPEEIRPTTTSTVLDETELDIIRRSIARGLGLERIPDPSKANVSQAEYERAHNEYLKKTQLSLDRRTLGNKKKLHVFPATAYPGNESSHLADVNESEGRYRHRLFFPVEVPGEDEHASPWVDHATLRLLLHGPRTDDYTERSELDVLLYLRTIRGSRKMVDRRIVQLRDTRNSRWLEFDATLAASSWLDGTVENLGLELEFQLDGEPVRRSFSTPFLNVFTAGFSGASGGRRKRSSPEELMPLHKGRRTKCKGESKKCCRHELTVMFKDLKGFEFIVYPKTFDAGYCKGRCPPRYNPAHHHALLQSLLWKEDRKKVPKPCCAPSKLDQLMIVYFDENDSTQLKVSYWKNIQVLECACS